jgi:hypothetical protein
VSTKNRRISIFVIQSRHAQGITGVFEAQQAITAPICGRDWNRPYTGMPLAIG